MSDSKRHGFTAKALAVFCTLSVLSALAVGYRAIAATNATFALQAKKSATVYPGQTTTIAVSLSWTSGYSGKVTLSASGLPSGVTGAFTTNPISPAHRSSTFVVNANPTPSFGIYTIKLRGTDGRTTSSVKSTLTVAHLPKSSFTLTTTSISGAVTPGSPATFAISISRTNDTDAVTLSVGSTLPTGVKGAFTPDPVGSSGVSSKLKLTTSSSTSSGSYLVEITGTGSTYATGTTAVLVVVIPQAFQVSGVAINSLSPGHASPIDLTFFNANPVPIYVTSVTVGVSGTSAGASCSTSNFATTSFSLGSSGGTSGSGGVLVPAKGSQSLSGAGVPQTSWPSISMLDVGNQDGCSSADVALTFSNGLGYSL